MRVLEGLKMKHLHALKKVQLEKEIAIGAMRKLFVREKKIFEQRLESENCRTSRILDKSQMSASMIDLKSSFICTNLKNNESFVFKNNNNILDELNDNVDESRVSKKASLDLSQFSKPKTILSEKGKIN